GGTDLDRWIALFEAAWITLDRSADAAKGKRLRTGPRGGGRSLTKIVDHVIESEAAYLGELDRARPPRTTAGGVAKPTALHATMVESIRRRAAGEMPEMGRRRSPFWTARYFIRRTAWHALDHAWEIEDRAAPG